MNLDKNDIKLLAVVFGCVGNLVVIMLFYWNWYKNQDLDSIEILIHNREILFFLIPCSILILWGGDSENFKF